METARNDLIDLLVQYRKIKKHDITVVFDGHKAGRGGENVTVTGGVAVMYSGLGERADEVIKRIISKDRKEWIVVSSDREIARHAWSVNSIPIPSGAFAEKVAGEVAANHFPQQAGIAANTIEEAEWGNAPYEDDEAVHSVRGNPHKLSKHEKSVRRALSKL